MTKKIFTAAGPAAAAAAAIMAVLMFVLILSKQPTEAAAGAGTTKSPPRQQQQQQHSPGITPTKSQVLRADSDLGHRLLANARRVEDNNQNQNQNQNQEEPDMTWITDYAIKFQGCHFVQQFIDQDGEGNGGGGGDQDGNNNVVGTKSLVRFRLCPIDTCDDDKDGGCSYRYGEYIIGLDTFVNVYYEHRRRTEEYECELYLQQYCYYCDGENNNNNGDDFNEEQCQYDCLAQADQGLESMCMDRNPYENNNNNNNNGNNGNQEEGEAFEVERYMECAEYELPQNYYNNYNNNQNNGGRRRGRRRRLEQQNEGSGLFIGPYCAEQGGAIYLGMFTNERCTEFVDDESRGASTFAYYEGMELPYATESIVTPQCVSCLNVDQEGNNNNNNNNNNNGNNNANDQVAELCQEVYQFSGKCEENLPSGVVDDPNNNACSYINGIQTIREDGMIGSSTRAAAAGASTAFVVLLCVVIFGLAFYVHYLRTKIARRSQRMNDPKQPLYPTEQMYSPGSMS